MHSRSITRTPQSDGRSGFTLVEMLVSVTLVLLMMTLFSFIFQLASDSVKSQRIIAENDRKVRALTGIVRADVAKRTMRRVQPFFPGELADSSPTAFGNRQGVFYISTNDPNSGSDDVLYLTVDATQTQQNPDTDPYFGHSELLVDRSAAPDPTSLTGSPNQPELDDGHLVVNSTSSSTAAEISYFIRNGNLYRRVLLLRDPLSLAGQELSDQPRNTSNIDFFAGYDNVPTYDGQFELNSDGLKDDFWTYFDHSAYPVNLGDVSDPTDGFDDFSAAFLGRNALSNDATTIALGKPGYRFGFDFLTGRSREHLGLDGLFMGRFLHAETSAANFNYPQQHSLVEGTSGRLEGPGGTPNGNPLDVDVTYSLFNRYGIIPEFDDETTGTVVGRGGPRAFEDLLLANVHEMRIEVWDERLLDYAPLRHDSLRSGTTVPGDYHYSRMVTTNAGPNTVTDTPGSTFGPSVFDTWHPSPNADLDNDGTVEESELHPPFRAYVYYPPVAAPPAMPAGPSPTTMTGPFGDGYWQSGTAYNVGDRVFAAYTDGDGDGFQWSDIATEFQPQGFDYIYECVDVTGTGNSGATEPGWPTVPSRVVTDNEVVWQVVDNRRPLKSIRITFQFENQQSGGMRQLSLELSLQD